MIEYLREMNFLSLLLRMICALACGAAIGLLEIWMPEKSLQIFSSTITLLRPILLMNNEE